MEIRVQDYSNEPDFTPGAPRRLTRLSAEIQSLYCSLERAGATACNADGREYPYFLGMAIENCQESLREVDRTTQGLEKICGRSKRLGRAAIALQEDKLQGLCGELERATTSLNFAFNIYSE